MSETTDTRATERNSAHWKHVILKCTRSFFLTLLCCVMVFAYSYKQPTEAHATAVVAVVGAVAVAAALSTLGICVSGTASTSSYAQACQNIWDNINDDIKAKVQVGTVYSALGYKLTTEFLTAVGNQVKTLYNTAATYAEIANDTGIQMSNSNYNKSFYQFGKDLGAIGGLTEYNCYFGGGLTISSYSILGVIPNLCEDSADYTIALGSSTLVVHAYDKWYQNYPYSISNGKSGTIKIPSMTSSDLCYVVAAQIVGVTGINYYLISTAYSNYSNVVELISGQADSAIPAAPGKDVYGINVDKWFADGYSALNNTVSDVVGRIGDKIGVVEGDGTIRVPVSVPSSDSVTDKTQSQTQSKTVNKDIASTQDKEKNTETNKKKNTSLPKPSDLPDLDLPKLITNKFPFCIPFDIYTIISGFYCSGAKAPHWEIPVVNKRFGWNWHIDIDFTQFEPVAVVCRWFNGAAWVFALILVTRKLIGAGGSD